ncbi:alpha/beta fold hydrolase [Amycolatopsis decaplanina]|uniref:Alpha/beta hydrolase fold protein n=1 Tax=Amycolatopsis decaplanina DSM 44594 TaxID=1284240 RepID=M2YV28_9PSEU|nr:alpha/beta hydrolase [Amycolatopsis decaplanina]EME52538.1 alpha/beta hydrolase fold protein [Amycolatopsis decaplanina DSM 44594]
MMEEPWESERAGTLDVPGAHLSYQVRGTGPVLLLIPGGPAGASMYDDIAPLLAKHHTVITYDPRGLSVSTVDDPSRDITVETQADDARRLLRTVTREPAYVFATSGGCATALELAATYPEQVRTLIVHEPSIAELLPGPEERRAHNADVYETARTVGASAALGKFLPSAGFDVPESPDPDELVAIVAMRDHLEEFFTPANLTVFFGPMWRPLAGYVPDLDALRTTPARVVVGVGTTSEGQFAYRTAVLLAERLDLRPVVFPGDHGGMLGLPEEFAACLLDALALPG